MTPCVTVLHAGIALLFLGAFGLANALYFVAVERRWMRPDPRWLPPVCRMDEQTCARVVDTRYARVFGVSNASLGMGWYLVIMASGLAFMVTGEVPARAWLVGVAAGTVALALYLVWALLVRLRTACPLCLLGHAINATILAVLAVA